MLKVAYCDDMEQDRQAIMKALTQIEEKWKSEFEIYSFSSGEGLCESMKDIYYDIILLDIQMDGMDGIETAMRIRNLGEDTLIIFVSSYDDRVKELFSFRTIAFLDKPVNTDKLEIALLDSYNIIKKDCELFFSYTKDGTELYLPLKDVVYFEVEKNIIYIHTKKNKEYYYHTLLGVWQQIEHSGQFILSHKSYIFNLKHITIKSDKVVIKETGESFNIGRKYKEDCQRRYVNYMEKRWE